MSATRAYVIVLAWPEGTTESSAVETLVHALGLDAWTARQRYKHVPYVPALTTEGAVKSVSSVLRERGVRHVIVTESMLDAVPPEHLAKRVSFTDETTEAMCYVEGWGGPRGGDVGFKCSDVFAIVRARVVRASASSTTTINHSPGLAMVSPVAAMLQPGTTTTRSSNARLVEVMDIWLLPEASDSKAFSECRRVRVRSDKISWDDLGAGKFSGDAAHADRFMAVLSQHCPKAAVDLDFETFVKGSRELLGAGWQSSAGVSAKQTKSRDTQPALELYSGAMAMVHHHRFLKNAKR